MPQSTLGSSLHLNEENEIYVQMQAEKKYNSIKVFVDEQEIKFDQEPIIKSGRTLVPLRGVFEALGATVEWNPKNRTVHISKGRQRVDLTIGSREATINNAGMLLLDVEAQLINNKTMVPLRFIGESMGAKVDWNGTLRIISIKTVDDPGYQMQDDKVNGYYIADLFEIEDENSINNFADFIIDKGYPVEKEKLVQVIKSGGYIREDHVRLYSVTPPRLSYSWVRVEWK